MQNKKTALGVKKELIRGGLGNGALKAVYIPLQFAIGVALARVLGPEDLGRYSYVLAIVYLVVIVVQFGFPSFLVKGIATYLQENEAGRAKGLLIIAIIAPLSISVLLGSLVYLSRNALFSDENLGPFYAPAIILSATLALTANLGAAMRVFGHTVKGSLADQLLKPMGIIVGLAVAYLISVPITASLAVWINLGASLAALGWSAWFVVRVVRDKFGGCAAIFEVKAWILGAVPFLLLAGAQVVNHQIDTVMLGVMLDHTAVGLYRIAVQIVDGLGIVFFAVSAVLAPKIAQLNAAKDHALLKKIMVWGHRVSLVVVAIPAVVLILYGEPVIRFFFGYEYVASSLPLSILLIGKILYAGFAYSGLALGMIGKAKVAAVVTFFVIFLNVTLNYIFIPLYGAAGASFATAVSSVAVNAVSVFVIYRSLGVNVSAFSLTK